MNCVDKSEEKKLSRRESLLRRAEDIFFQSCYAPVDLKKMLESADTRSQIRRLPAAQLFYPAKELSDSEIQALLPHITEEQWAGILDLDLWTKDRARMGRFLSWQRHIVNAEPSVARKLLRGTDNELWELAFRRDLIVYPRTEEDEHAAEPGDDDNWMETPDREFLIILPKNPEKAKVYENLILRLYELDPENFKLMLLSSQCRTPTELAETAYQLRTRRMEDLGFQDYFDALEIFSYRRPDEQLPAKRWDQPVDLSQLPAPIFSSETDTHLLFQALQAIPHWQQASTLMEELAYVTNKLLAAERTSPAEPARVKKGIRKTLMTINLGLECWSGGSLQKAIEGLTHHYLLSFFQLGYSRLLDLQNEARKIPDSAVEPGSLGEAVIESLLRRFPLFTVERKGRLRRRLFETRADLNYVQEILKELKSSKETG